ncbi:MAG: hypothetical protein ACOVLE_11170 [Pirellula staleyi]
MSWGNTASGNTASGND